MGKKGEEEDREGEKEEQSRQAFESSVVKSNRRHRGKTVSTNVPFFLKLLIPGELIRTSSTLDQTNPFATSARACLLAYNRARMKEEKEGRVLKLDVRSNHGIKTPSQRHHSHLYSLVTM